MRWSTRVFVETPGFDCAYSMNICAVCMTEYGKKEKNPGRGKRPQGLLVGCRYRDRHSDSDCLLSSRRGIWEKCFCLLLGGASRMRPENSGTSSKSTSCRSWDYGIRGEEPDRLKDICVSQSPRQNIDLVGMKAGPRDAEGLRHSRVVGGRRSDGAGLLRPVTQTGVGGW